MKGPAEKKKVVEQLVKDIENYPIVGIVDMEDMPTPQLQAMRAKLRDRVKITMTKKRLINLALEKANKKDIGKLKDYVKGMPAMIFTEENPFKLFKTIKKNKSSAPAKPGQTAPKNIVVPAGPTAFAPGPIIGELGSIGVKAGVENGKVTIKEDAVVAKEGEEISDKLAGLLSRLKIEPMEIGLDVTGIYEEGTIFPKSVLDIDEEKFKSDISKCASWAFNLAMETGTPTKETLPLLITKAHSEARAISLGEDILTDETADDILAKAEAQAAHLNSLAEGKGGQ